MLKSASRNTALLAEAVVANETHGEFTGDNKRIEG